MRRRAWTLIAIGLIAGLAAASLPACESLPTLDADTVQALGDAVSDLKQQVQASQDRLAALPDDQQADPTVAATAKALEQTLPVLESIEQSLPAHAADDADLAVAKTGIRTASKFLPEPWGSLAALFGGLGVGLLGAYRERQRAKRVVTGLEVAKDVAGVVDFSNAETAKRLDAVLTAGDKRLIDRVQAKKVA